MLLPMIASLRNQSRAPDQIVVNLSRQPYLRDEGFAEEPPALNGAGVRLNWVENTGPYRKLLPALDLANDDDVIVTVDDDVIYHSGWLEALLDLSTRYPDDVVCVRARRMRRAPLGNWQNYKNWSSAKHFMRGMHLLPTGCSGVLYKKHLLDLGFLADTAFKALAPTADDLWFRMAGMLQGTRITVDPRIGKQVTLTAHEHGLEQFNELSARVDRTKPLVRALGHLRDYCGWGGSENDRSWRRICAYVRSHRVH